MAKRPLSNEERQIWHRVTRDVRRAGGTLPDRAGPDELLSAGTGKSEQKRAGKRAVVAKPLSAEPELQPFQSLLNAGDPRSTRHVRRGRREIDAALDLHGMNQQQAFAALQHFLMAEKAKGHRVVLVITGKGQQISPRNVLSYSSSRGILRQRFLQWIDGPFRQDIVSVRPAHQRHGGTGAFYVFLKKS